MDALDASILTNARNVQKFLIRVLHWVSEFFFKYTFRCSGKIGIFSQNFSVHNFYSNKEI